MRRPAALALSLALLAASGCTVPDGVSEQLRIETEDQGFVLWRGFTHLWTHNHRWNRFGNWVEERPADCSGSARCFGLAHSAASGTSGDVAAFTASWSEIAAPGVGFAQMTDDLLVEEFFGEPAVWTRVGLAQIPLADEVDADELRDRDRYLAVLNGWDLYADEESRAAKPIDFALELGEASYDPDSDSLSIPWRTFLRMGCSTEECSTVETWYSYHVRPTIAVLGYDDELIVAHDETVGRTYHWDAPPNLLGHGTDPNAPEVNLPPLLLTAPASEAVGWTPLFRSLALHLYHWQEDLPNADQHMVGWKSDARLTGREGDTLRFDVNLEFKNWIPGMRRYQGFAYEDVGAASITTRVAVVGWPQAERVVHGTWRGSHRWRVEGRSAAGDDAITRSWEVMP